MLHGNKKRTDFFFYLSLAILGLLLFRLPGTGEPVLYSDSESYMTVLRYAEGVMPVYPLYLQLNRFLFGEEIYLIAVNWEQAVFATVCLMLFVAMLRKRFELPYFMGYGCFLFGMLPFTTNLPEGMTTQTILTEGIAYAAFYLFMGALLKSVWEKNVRWFLALLFMVVFLSALRAQMQILYGVCGLVFWYILMTKRKKGRLPGWFLALLGLAGCAVISLSGIWLTSRISSAYQQQIVRNIVRYNQEHAQEQGNGDKDAETVRAESEAHAQRYIAAPNQYVTLILSRTMYEAEEQDYRLFEEQEMQEIYLAMFQAVDEEQCRYVYATPGLWMWKDIVGGIGRIGGICTNAQNEYYEEHADVYAQQDYATVRNGQQLQIGVTLLKAHFGRFLYHTLMLMPQAFISTVFFQIAPIYLLCHIATLLLYLSALALMIWGFADSRTDKGAASFMAAVLGVNLILIGVISIIFFGQQRYMVYNFGIFYMSYIVLLWELWKTHGKSWITRWKEKRKS
mgnify:FL=1